MDVVVGLQDRKRKSRRLAADDRSPIGAHHMCCVQRARSAQHRAPPVAYRNGRVPRLALGNRQSAIEPAGGGGHDQTLRTARDCDSRYAWTRKDVGGTSTLAPKTLSFNATRRFALGASPPSVRWIDRVRPTTGQVSGQAEPSMTVASPHHGALVSLGSKPAARPASKRCRMPVANKVWPIPVYLSPISKLGICRIKLFHECS